MELQQLRYVVAVAEERNFTRAAARCHVVQSALSHQIKALERELEVALFARTSRRVELTPAGRAFLPHAQAALDAAARAAVEAAAAAGEIRGRLVVSVIPTVRAVDLPGELARFRRRHPGAGITLRLASSDETMAAIARGEVDVGFLGLSAHRVPEGVSWRELATDRLVAAVPASHALARRARIRLEELAEMTFADFLAGSPGREQTDRAFATAGVARTVDFEAMDTDVLLGFVREGLAVSLLPSRFVSTLEGIAVCEIVDGPRRVEFVAWSGFNPSPAALAFVELVGEAAG